MKRVMFALLLAMVIAPSAWAQSWPNEPAGSTVINDWNWNSCPGGGWQPAYGCGQIISDPTAPFSASSVLRFSYNPSTGQGGGDPYIDLGNQNEVYIGLWGKMSNPYQGYENQANKVWVVFLSDGSTIWLEQRGLQYGPFNVVMTLSYLGNVNNCHLPGWGDCPGPYNVYPNASSGVTSLGVWQRFEVHLKRSTSPTARDGIVRVWVDGALAINVTNANTPAATFSQLFITPSWDGADCCGQHTNPDQRWFDHIRVSAPSGSGGTPKGDTTPPAAPTSLRAS